MGEMKRRPRITRMGSKEFSGTLGRDGLSIEYSELRIEYGVLSPARCYRIVLPTTANFACGRSHPLADSSLLRKPAMDITLSQVIVWLIVGALAGSFVGMVFRRKREGFGAFLNLLVGLVGALIGGATFRALNIDLGLGNLNVTFEDLIAAIGGSIVFLILVWLVRRWLKKEKQ